MTMVHLLPVLVTGEEKIAAHENAQIHRASIIALTARKHVSEQIHKRLIQEYESECEYWRAILIRTTMSVRFTFYELPTVMGTLLPSEAHQKW